MIAPVNCCSDCDCAQRMVRCQRAAPVGKPISWGPSAAEHNHDGSYGYPPMVIPASLGEQKKNPLSDFSPEELLAAGQCRVVRLPEGTMADVAFEAVEYLGRPLEDVEIDEMNKWTSFNRQRKHDRLVHAFRTCQLDCGMWSDNALNELADIAIATLEST